MRIVLSPTEWREKLILFSQDELNSPDRVYPFDEVNGPAFDSEKAFRKYCIVKNRKLNQQYKMRMIQMRPLFAGLPQFEKICKNRSNRFVDSCCNKYLFEYKNEDDDKDTDEYGNINQLHENVIDLKYIINLCGYNLTQLNVRDYPFSEIMPLINNNCSNIKKLHLCFKEINSQDFENVFSNMSHLNWLSIEWRCEYSALPISLVESLEKIGGILEYFFLECFTKKNDFCLPHSLASVFLGFVVLKHLYLNGFELNQPLLESIGQMQSLIYLTLMFSWKEYQMLENKINMYPIGNLKKLYRLTIDFDCGVTNEFLINLCNNARRLNSLSIVNTHITDDGMNALKNLKKPVVLDIHRPYKKLS